MFAKSEEVAEWFRANWNELTEKTYVARVEGELEDERGVFESWLREDEDGYKVRSLAAPEAERIPLLRLNSALRLQAARTPLPHLKPPKLARTEWRKISVEDGTTLVEAKLKSGRKNQIRVHFSEAGHPVVGDVKYGGQKASRMYLHSARLRFKHPKSGEWMEFEAGRTLDGRRETQEDVRRKTRDRKDGKR